MAFTLRDYQENAVSDVRLALRSGYKSPILVLSTGAGKTVIFSYIAKNAAEKGKRVLILAHRDQLIKQASRKLNDYDVPHGIIMAGFTPNKHARVQVASVQTLVRRIEKMKATIKAKGDEARAKALAAGLSPEAAEEKAIEAEKKEGFDLIVIDEAHLSAAASYIKILAAFVHAVILGVTGSPCRLDNKPLGKEYGGIYDYMIQGISIRELITRGFLVRPVVYAPAEQLDLSGIKKTMGDYDTQELAAVVDKPKITGSAVEHYKRICPNAPAIAWCVTVQHAQHVADEFQANGIRAVMLCGDDESDVRDRALKGLETGEIQIICFVGILIEGVDCPAISAIIMLRPSMSLSSYLQVIGRGLRPHVDRFGVKKEACYILDHAGLTFRHGLADEERDWSLDWGEKKKGKKKPQEKPVDVIQCKGCFGVFSPVQAAERGEELKKEDPSYSGAPCCPFCDKAIAIRARKLDHVDGELREITPEMAEAMSKKKKAEVKGAKTLQELERIAAQRGYSPGWAKHTYEARARIREKYRPKPPPPPTLEELKTMSLDQLVIVGNQQGYPAHWASDFFYSQRALGG